MQTRAAASRATPAAARCQARPAAALGGRRSAASSSAASASQAMRLPWARASTHQKESAAAGRKPPSNGSWGQRAQTASRAAEGPSWNSNRSMSCWENSCTPSSHGGGAGASSRGAGVGSVAPAKCSQASVSLGQPRSPSINKSALRPTTARQAVREPGQATHATPSQHRLGAWQQQCCGRPQLVASPPGPRQPSAPRGQPMRPDGRGKGPSKSSSTPVAAAAGAVSQGSAGAGAAALGGCPGCGAATTPAASTGISGSSIHRGAASGRMRGPLGGPPGVGAGCRVGARRRPPAGCLELT
mmetsp:Transcript_55976/g.173411  ORF Transcript_55976/g.173411 Transcript_55976/m.173411 type:complete len:300 (+) Transcript_55976:1903-2802(+)